MTTLENGIGLDIVLWFQGWRSPLLESIALVFDKLGGEDFMLMLFPIIYWSFDAAFGRRLGFFLFLSQWSGSLLKGIFKLPRPFQVAPEQVQNLVSPSSYALPSGHTQGATVLAGLIAYQAKRHWVTAVAVIYIVVVGLFRIIAGVHYPQDVLAGMLVGLLLIMSYPLARKILITRIQNRSLRLQIGMMLALCAGLFLIHSLLIATPDGQENLITAISGFAGLAVGVLMERYYLHFNARGPVWQRLLRLVPGLIFLLILRSGLKIVFSGLNPALVFRFIRYGLIGLWIGFGAPWLFVKLKLAESTRNKPAGESLPQNHAVT